MHNLIFLIFIQILSKKRMFDLSVLRKKVPFIIKDTIFAEELCII